MKNLIMLCLMLLISSAISAQVTNRTITDDPTVLNNVGVRLYPWVADISFGKKVGNIEVERVSIGMGYGFDVFADPIPVLGDKLGVLTRYRKAYFDGVDAIIDQEKIRSTQFEFGVSWELFSNRTKKKENLIIGESTRGNTTTTTSINGVEKTRLHRLMVDIGMFSAEIPITSYTTGLQSYDVITSTTGFFGGLKYSQSMNYKSAVSGYGTGSDAVRINAYAHVMLAPTIKYSDIIIPREGFSSNGPDIEAHLDSNNAIPNLGGRVGLSVDVNPAALISYSFITELGYKPPLNGFHIYLGASIMVNLNIRPKKKKS